VTSDLTNVADGTWKHYTEAPKGQKIHVTQNFPLKFLSFFSHRSIHNIMILMEVGISGMLQLAKRKILIKIVSNSFPISEAEIRQLMTDQLNYDNSGDYFDENSRAYIFQSLFYEPNRLVIIERVIVIFEISYILLTSYVSGF